MADKSQWFRVSTRITDSKKIHALSDAHFRWVVLFWAEARKNDGILPPVEDMEFHLRRPAARIQKAIEELRGKRFLELVDGHFVPHDWDEHQWEETSSTDRVKRHRERKRNGDETLHETPKKRDETPLIEEKNRVTEKSRADETFHCENSCREFIEAYPNGKRTKPGAVERWYAFNVAQCVEPSKLHAEIMAGLERAKNSEAWARADGKYICGMLNFLEDQRWREPWPGSESRETPDTRLEDLD